MDTVRAPATRRWSAQGLGAHMGLRPGGLHPAPLLQGTAFQLSLRAGGGAGEVSVEAPGPLEDRSVCLLRAGTKQ